VIDPHTYLLFVATAIVIIVTPGPDTLLVLSRTLASGPRAGLWAALGTQVGDFAQAMLAGLGISTLVLLYPVALGVLRVVGVAYLLWLAVQAWRTGASSADALDAAPAAGADRALGWFTQGLTNNLVNAKMIAFFVALFPQFLAPAAGHLALQAATLGASFAVLGFTWLAVLVAAAGHARARFARSPAFVRLVRRAAALVFVGLAARLALSRR
jgi:threonine/homoserine/homoserine lactone efflux protein